MLGEIQPKNSLTSRRFVSYQSTEKKGARARSLVVAEVAFGTMVQPGGKCNLNAHLNALLSAKPRATSGPSHPLLCA
jgi:hypothetical protein